MNIIIHGFVESKEFSDLCKQYGILRGSVNLSRIADQYPEITKFLVRKLPSLPCREADKKGLNEWCEAIRSGQNTAKEAAAGFVFSREFEKKELSDEDFIKTMYNVFMDREADEIGMQEWQQDSQRWQNAANMFLTWFCRFQGIQKNLRKLRNKINKSSIAAL